MTKERRDTRIDSRKPVIWVPTLDDLMMIAQGAIKSGTFHKGNSLILYTNEAWSGTRLLTDLPILQGNGHADTGPNQGIMIAKTPMSRSTERLAEIAGGLKGYFDEPMIVDEISGEEYRQILEPYEVKYLSGGSKIIEPFLPKSSRPILRLKDPGYLG